ncbi:RNA polymerase sigma factor RpoS [Vibrio cholerae]|nr:RNA polymerase sigma factor RpoS [Vibrio cholerae]
MSVSNTVTKVEEFDFEDEALEVLETELMPSSPVMKN